MNDLAAEPRTVLVVDDDPLTREDIANKLQSLNVGVLLAQNGEQALTQLEMPAAGPDAVICDIRMPKIDGFELARRIREVRPKVPVILMSAADDINSPIRAMRSHAFDFQLKPVKLADLKRLMLRLEQVWEQAAPLSAIVRGDYEAVLEVRVPTQLDLTRRLAAKLRDHFRDNLLSAGVDAGRFMVAIIEALENAVIHGNLGITSELRDQDLEAYERLILERLRNSERAGKTIDIKTRLTREVLLISVTDEGEGFDYSAVPDEIEVASSAMCSGRGLLIIRQLMDEVTWSDGGRTISMTLRLNPDS